MNKPFVGEGKLARLRERMVHLGIRESDLTERFILGAGKGGQKINKTASCVHLRHTPSGIELKCQATRSLAVNRYYARMELCSRYEERILGEKTEERMEMERVRRQKRRRSRRQRERMLADKRRQGEKKARRGAVRIDE